MVQAHKLSPKISFESAQTNPRCDCCMSSTLLQNATKPSQLTLPAKQLQRTTLSKNKRRQCMPTVCPSHQLLSSCMSSCREAASAASLHSCSTDHLRPLHLQTVLVGYQQPPAAPALSGQQPPAGEPSRPQGVPHRGAVRCNRIGPCIPCTHNHS